MTALIGQNVNGYIVGSVLGEGAMGRVHRAIHTATQRTVAIKVMQPEFANDPDYRARFLREAELMETLKHPHIVAVYAFGEWSGYLYIVMQMVQGPTLDQIVQHHRFSPLTVWHIVRPVTEALGYGHSLGVLHRDLKPANILLEKREGTSHLLLTDFGLGKRPGLDTTLTEAGVAVGTPEYMAPEMVMGGRVDHRADIYSLGVMIYELLLGRLPFRKDTAQLTAMAQMDEMLPPPRAVHPDFPHRLELILYQVLDKHPDGRYLTAGELRRAYFEALKGMTDAERRRCYWPN